MKTIEGWHDEQRAESLFALREGDNPLLEFVKMHSANRHNSPLQARLATAGNALADYMGKDWEWLAEYIKMALDFELTSNIKTKDARQELLEAIIFDRQMAQEKGNGSIIFNTGGGK